MDEEEFMLGDETSEGEGSPEEEEDEEEAY
jgi:hypothetical protein